LILFKVIVSKAFFPNGEAFSQRKVRMRNRFSIFRFFGSKKYFCNVSALKNIKKPQNPCVIAPFPSFLRVFASMLDF